MPRVTRTSPPSKRSQAKRVKAPRLIVAAPWASLDVAVESVALVEPDARSVTDLLAASFSAHQTKKRAAGTIDKNGAPTEPDYPKAEQCIALALVLRLQAHANDPDHTDPAWASDLLAHRGVTHDALVQWYRDYAEIP